MVEIKVIRNENGLEVNSELVGTGFDVFSELVAGVNVALENVADIVKHDKAELVTLFAGALKELNDSKEGNDGEV